jgi:hypothetical protein
MPSFKLRKCKEDWLSRFFRLPHLALLSSPRSQCRSSPILSLSFVGIILDDIKVDFQKRSVVRVISHYLQVRGDRLLGRCPLLSLTLLGNLSVKSGSGVLIK